MHRFNWILWRGINKKMYYYYLPLQSFQVEGPQNREISLYLRNKIGRFFTGTFQGNYGSPSASFTFFGIASQSDVVKPGDDNDMPFLCLPMSARAKLRCRRRLGSFLSKPFICYATLLDIVRKKTLKHTTMAYLGKAFFLAGFGSQ